MLSLTNETRRQKAFPNVTLRNDECSECSSAWSAQRLHLASSVMTCNMSPTHICAATLSLAAVIYQGHEDVPGAIFAFPVRQALINEERGCRESFASFDLQQGQSDGGVDGVLRRAPPGASLQDAVLFMARSNFGPVYPGKLRFCCSSLASLTCGTPVGPFGGGVSHPRMARAWLRKLSAQT